jgi:hypothetical protein
MSRLNACFIAVVLVVYGSTALFAQVPGPLPQHAKLKELEGKWNFVLKPSQGDESKGVSEFKLECGGLWLTSDFSTSFGGAPFQGKGLDGYDPDKKKYVSIWVDSMTPAPMLFEGDYDATGKVLTMISKAAGPDGKPATWKSISKFISTDEHTFEMFVTPAGGKEMSMMVVTYKRAK